MTKPPKQPLSEVFGFPIDNMEPEAQRYRSKRLCPFNNKVPNCTKDKANDPLGVCSIHYVAQSPTITCPIRFREDWRMADDAAAFFFPADARWTSLTELRLNDRYGKSAGNIDVVLVSYDQQGRIVDFGALEVQAVYISGTIRGAFQHYMRDPGANQHMDWSRQRNYPRPDYLSSSRKRLAPQLIFKGGILSAWGKKQAVAVDSAFFDTLPRLDQVPQEEAGIAWLVYDLVRDTEKNRYKLTHVRTVHTNFYRALERITTAEPGSVGTFINQLQKRLDGQLNDAVAPDTRTLAEASGEDGIDPEVV